MSSILKLFRERIGYNKTVKTGIILFGISTLSYIAFKLIFNYPKINKPTLPIKEFIKDQIWTQLYRVSILGTVYYARCTIIKLSNNKYLIHSPSPLNNELLSFFNNKEIEYIVGPSNFHWINVYSWKQKFPNSKVLLCPGIAEKETRFTSNDIYGILNNTWIDNDKDSAFHRDFDIRYTRGFDAVNVFVVPTTLPIANLPNGHNIGSNGIPLIPTCS